MPLNPHWMRQSMVQAASVLAFAVVQFASGLPGAQVRSGLAPVQVRSPMPAGGGVPIITGVVEAEPPAPAALTAPVPIIGSASFCVWEPQPWTTENSNPKAAMSCAPNATRHGDERLDACARVWVDLFI